MKEFFGFSGWDSAHRGEYLREASGAYSWQHLTFVTSLVLLMTLLAVCLGFRNRKRNEKQKNRPLIAAAVLIDALEVFKIVLCCVRSHNAMDWLNNLPLYLCSIQLITIPLAAFSKGQARQASLDFVAVFGLLGALAGTYGAAQNYSAYPVLGFDNVISGVTHCISGFCSLYILLCGMASMKWRNYPNTSLLMLVFCALAYAVDRWLDKNYMFLMRSDGTPYNIVEAMTGSRQPLYAIAVVVLFLVYIVIFYALFHLFRKKRCCGNRQSSSNIQAK